MNSVFHNNGANVGNQTNALVTVNKVALEFKHKLIDNRWSHQYPMDSLLFQQKEEVEAVNQKLMQGFSEFAISNTFLNLWQLNYLLAVEAKVWLKENIEKHTPDMNEKYYNFCQSLEDKWSLAGVCMTPPDPFFQINPNVQKSRMLVCTLRGHIDVQNLWSDNTRVGDYCFVTFEMKKVNLTTEYVVSEDSSKVVVDFNEIGLEAGHNVVYIPQFTAMSSVDVYIHPKNNCTTFQFPTRIGYEICYISTPILVGRYDNGVGCMTNKAPPKPNSDRDICTKADVVNMKLIGSRDKILMNVLIT